MARDNKYDVEQSYKMNIVHFLFLEQTGIMLLGQKCNAEVTCTLCPKRYPTVRFTTITMKR